VKDEVLAELNRDLPNLDWRKGAQDYVRLFFEKYTRAQIEEFIFTKPLGAITPEDPIGAITENASYLFNFASSIQLLKLKRGSRVLDVACGGGWYAHWL
jgi:2-polyprenyl-3-methyl-5-hydroxy-6-metoxy-1,4-benzoquinol methylase